MKNAWRLAFQQLILIPSDNRFIKGRLVPMKKYLFQIIALATLFLPITFLQAVSFKSAPGFEYLEQTSKAFTEIGKKASPAVVFIKSQYKSPGNNAFRGPEDFFNPFDFFNHEDFFRRFFNQSNTSPQVSGGSGFLVDPNGYILTNFHVIKEADTITVVLNDAREYEASIVGVDPRTDLAVLKIEEQNLPFLEFGDSSNLEKGEWVIAIGNPFALESSLTVGVVGATGRQDLGIATLEDFIQTDAAINPGNSGGPLLNLNGDVVGINTAIFTRSGGNMGIGFAIPSNLGKHVTHQIVQTGVVKRAYLGIILQAIDKSLADAMNLNQSEGILVAEVVADSPAEKAGLKNGDIILSLNGKAVKNINKFRNEIALMDPGTQVQLQILRQHNTLNLQIELGTLTEEEVASAELSQKMGLGIEVENLDKIPPEVLSRLGYSPNMEGVMITKVKPGSPAALAGLRPYYLITGVVVNWNNQKKVKNAGEFQEAIREVSNKNYVVLIVRHQNYQRYYTLKLK